jgi:hypothetical protein
MNKPEIRLTKGAKEFFGRYSWPGIYASFKTHEGIISTHEENAYQ